MHLIHSGKFSRKKILLIDKGPKNANDRTWCFWQKENSLFEDLVCKKWEKLWFHGVGFSKEIAITPYQYKMIRGIDFYDYCLSTIGRQSNFDILFGNVEKIFSQQKSGVVVNGQTIYAEFIFNSIVFEKPVPGKNEYWLLQHFKGWFIETAENCFNETVATLMDFRIDQKHGSEFCYVLPLNSRQALVEYTVFSSELLQQNQYDDMLEFYINSFLKIPSYKILEKEFGVIPMTNHKFPSYYNHIIHIGTAGGQTKGSSGYTFNFIQKHSKAIVDSLITTSKPFVEQPSGRFNFYDSVLLQILKKETLPGRQIFTDLFRNNPVDKVFKFLDNETSLAEEWKIISSLPMFPFLKAGIQQLI
jgi:lycopene beta-cyclase